MPTWTLPIPPSTNRLWRRSNFGGRPVTHRAKDYEAWLADGEVAAACLWQPPPGPLAVKIVVNLPPRQMGRDLDNCGKAAIDAVVGKEHDSRIVRLTLEKYRALDKIGNVRVTVEPIGAATASKEEGSN